MSGVVVECHSPVESPLGFMHGRDCIFLDALKFENGTSQLILEGEVNGKLCSLPRSTEFIPYRLKFTGILAFKMVELDSWDYSGESCFDEVLQSQWARSLGGKVTERHRHFVLQTYDDVFEVVCEGYEFIVDGVPGQPAAR